MHATCLVCLLDCSRDSVLVACDYIQQLLGRATAAHHASRGTDHGESRVALQGSVTWGPRFQTPFAPVWTKLPLAVRTSGAQRRHEKAWDSAQGTELED